MQELYNCKRLGQDKSETDHYKITKFDKHLHPKCDHTGHISSYTVTEHGCDCPQGHAQTCRHRKMLPFFIQHDYVDTEYFFVWDQHRWYKAPAAVAEARAENGRKEPAKPVNQIREEARELFAANDAILNSMNNEGAQKAVSEAPSPPPSTYRRF